MLRLEPDDPNYEKNLKAADRYLRRKRDEVGAARQGLHRFITPAQRRMTVNEMLDALEADYRIRDKHNVKLVSNIIPLRQHFGTCRAADLTAEMVDGFIEHAQQHGRRKDRRGEPAKKATINRSTQLLKQAYKLAVKRKHLSADSVPEIRRLSEKDNIRQGYFEEPDFRRVVEYLAEYLRDFVLFAFITGWRKGGISKLRWENLHGDVILLPGSDWKNGDPQTMTLEGELAEIIERRRAARAVKTSTGVFLSEWVFHHNGKPIGDFRKAWARACRAAGLKAGVKVEGGKIPHDLCRTAARDLDNSGVSRPVAMSIMGRKTESIYTRYRIVPEKDKRAGLRRREEYMRAQQAATMPSTVAVQ